MNADHLLELREEMRNRNKIRYDTNDSKLKGIVDDLEAPDRRIILRAKKNGSCLSVQSITITSTLLAPTVFCNFFCARYDVTPPNLLKTVTDAISPSMYVTDLAVSTEVSTLHITTKCVTSSSTIIDNLSSLKVYSENSSSKKDEADQMRRCVRGVIDQIQEMMFSSDGSGKSRLIPYSSSYLEARTRTPTSTNQWISSWIGGRSRRKISMLITATSNIIIF